MDTKDATAAPATTATTDEDQATNIVIMGRIMGHLTEEVVRLVRAIEADQRRPTPALRSAADHARQVLYRFGLTSPGTD